MSTFAPLILSRTIGANQTSVKTEVMNRAPSLVGLAIPSTNNPASKATPSTGELAEIMASRIAAIPVWLRLN